MQELARKPCAICQDSEAAPLYVLDGLRVVRCRRCGLEYVDENMGSSEIERMYDTGDYHQDHFSFYFPGLEQRLVDDYLEDVRRVEAMLPERPRVLDVGCADGLFLARLPERFEKHGVDISRPAVEKGITQHGLDLVCGDLLDPAATDLFEEATFDLVTLWAILEHLQDPRGAVKRVARLVKQGGLVMIRVPNADGLLNSVARALYRVTFGRVRGPLAYFYTRLHIYNFGAAQLRRLLESCGLQVIQVFYDERYVTKHALPYLPWRLAGPLGALKVVSRLLQRQDFITVCAARR